MKLYNIIRNYTLNYNLTPSQVIYLLCEYISTQPELPLITFLNSYLDKHIPDPEL